MDRFDAAIIGSGFSGSILARVLASRGLSVALIDSQFHPRFAIGESSTPIADAMLRQIGLRYELNDLVSLSTWGSWQREHPDLDCGLKRGFSYFAHRRGEAFNEASLGERSLLAAASPSDEVADTHWYRSDMDQYLFDRAIETGVTAMSGCSLVAVERANELWELTIQADCSASVRTEWLIDASGQSGVLAKQFGSVDLSDKLRTRTHSVFGHFTNVPSWSAMLLDGDVPFDADAAAQHHLLDDGWMWMLRFSGGITSVGYTSPLDRPLDWNGFPSIDALLADAVLVGPAGGLRRTGRLQRLYDPVLAERAIMLPTAALTLDPLHSTGIAHALAGVDRVAEIVLQTSESARAKSTAAYRENFLRETRLLDQLVSTAYTVMNDFPRFTAACMIYFAGAIACEERLQSGEMPTSLWNADDRAFTRMTGAACRLIEDPKADDFENRVRAMLSAWNTAGLMDPRVQNRYVYTATK